MSVHNLEKTKTGNAAQIRSGLGSKLAHTLRVEYKKNGQLWLMILPVLLGFFLFKFMPLLGSIIAFMDYNLARGILGSDWVGLENFRKFFTDPFFFRVVKNTVVLGIWQVLFQIFPPIILAISFNEVRRRHKLFKSGVQSVSQLPQFIAVVVVVGIVFDFFSSEGIVNQLVAGLGAEPIRFLSSPGWFRPLFVGSRTWQQMGWEAIIYAAALTTIDDALYEAATVDGASRWQLIRHITIPGIVPLILILSVKAVADIFIVGFERAYLLQTPSTYSVSDVIQTYVYRKGIQSLDFSYATAVGLVEGVASFALVIIANQVVKRISDDGQGLW